MVYGRAQVPFVTLLWPGRGGPGLREVVGGLCPCCRHPPGSSCGGRWMRRDEVEAMWRRRVGKNSLVRRKGMLCKREGIVGGATVRRVAVGTHRHTRSSHLKQYILLYLLTILRLIQ